MTYQKYSDEELVLAVRENKGAGFDEIIDRYQEKLLRYAATICRDQEAAQDVVQEAFISAYQNLNGFDPKRKFSSWIYRIVHNKAINEWRRNKNKISFHEVRETEGAVNAPEISKRIDQKQASEIIKTIIIELPSKYREPLILRYYEEKSYEEISDILKMPVSTVGIRIKRGAEKIRKMSNLEIKEYL